MKSVLSVVAGKLSRGTRRDLGIAGHAGRRRISLSDVTVSLAVSVLCCQGAFAAGPIDTDGPDFVDSSEVVGKNRFQFEADLVADRNRRDPAHRRTISTPTLLKYGITDSLELRLDTAGWNWSTVAPDGGPRVSETGAGDTALSVKWHSQNRDSSAGVPAVSWIADAVMPSGGENFKGHGVRPSLRSVVTWDLPRDFNLALMPGLKYDATSQGHRYLSGMLGINVGKGWSESFRTFVEGAFAQVAPSEDGGILAYWDVGAAYLITNDWQVGFRFAIPANHNTPNSYTLIELAGRF